MTAEAMAPPSPDMTRHVVIGRALVSEIMVELGLTERPEIVYGELPEGYHGMYYSDWPPLIVIVPNLPTARWRQVLRHELYHHWQACNRLPCSGRLAEAQAWAFAGKPR